MTIATGFHTESRKWRTSHEGLHHTQVRIPGKRGLYTHCVNTNRQGSHPTAKPVPLMMEIVADFTKPGDTILDPFAGGGSTGVACARLGRKFIGIEKNPNHFAEMCQRIEAAYRQADLFVPAPEIKMVQGAML